MMTMERLICRNAWKLGVGILGNEVGKQFVKETGNDFREEFREEFRKEVGDE